MFPRARLCQSPDFFAKRTASWGTLKQIGLERSLYDDNSHSECRVNPKPYVKDMADCEVVKG